MDIIGARMRAEGEIAGSGYEIIYRNNLTGRVNFSIKTCHIPRIKSRRSLYIALHELGHIMNGNVRPTYMGEFLAETYAHARMREMGFSVPRSMTDRAKSYVRYEIFRAKRRGARIDPTVQEWTGLLAINT